MTLEGRERMEASRSMTSLLTSDRPRQQIRTEIDIIDSTPLL